MNYAEYAEHGPEGRYPRYDEIRAPRPAAPRPRPRAVGDRVAFEIGDCVYLGTIAADLRPGYVLLDLEGIEGPVSAALTDL